MKFLTQALTQFLNDEEELTLNFFYRLRHLCWVNYNVVTNAGDAVLLAPCGLGQENCQLHVRG